jgi:hypothetical protein
MIRSSIFAQALSAGTVVLAVACGGKILDDGAVTSEPGPSAPGAPSGNSPGGPTASAAPSPGSPTGPSGPVVTGPAPTKTAPIACGSTSCDGATQDCCITVGGGGGGGSSTAGGPGGGAPSSAVCTPKGKCDGDIALSCSSTASCASGQVCCANLNADAPTAVCQASCGGGGGGGGGGGVQQLCASDKDCPMGRRCQDTEAGFKFCRRSGP